LMTNLGISFSFSHVPRPMSSARRRGG
jgi:hypothetical protein